MSKVKKEMLNFTRSFLTPAETCIPGAIVWVGYLGGKLRIDIALQEKYIGSVSLTSPPKVTGRVPAKIKSKLIKFVELNLRVLIDYWEFKISTREMMDSIEKVE